VSQRGSLGVVAVPVFGQAFDADGKTGGGVVVAGLLSVVVAGFDLALGFGMVLGVVVGAAVQFVVLICVSPGAGRGHCAVFELLFGLVVTGDSGVVTGDVVCAAPMAGAMKSAVAVAQASNRVFRINLSRTVL
jgi:hypothetical protein